MDRAVESTEAEARGVLHSVGRGLGAPFRAVNRANTRAQHRMRPSSPEEAALASGLIPSHTAALLGKQ